MPDEVIADIVKQPVANRNKKGYYIPEMFNETRHMLEEFYKPFNEKLGYLIGQGYNYNIDKWYCVFTNVHGTFDLVDLEGELMHEFNYLRIEMFVKVRMHP